MPEPEPTSDFRSLVELPGRAWSSPETEEKIRAAREVKEIHERDAVRDNEKAAAEKSRDLATVRGTTPLQKLQARLRYARSARSYYELVVDAADALLRDSALHVDRLKEIATKEREETKAVLDGLGLLPHAPPNLLSFFAKVRKPATELSLAISDQGGIRSLRNDLAGQKAAAEKAIEWIEDRIRREIDAK